MTASLSSGSTRPQNGPKKSRSSSSLLLLLVTILLGCSVAGFVSLALSYDSQHRGIPTSEQFSAVAAMTAAFRLPQQLPALESESAMTATMAPTPPPRVYVPSDVFPRWDGRPKLSLEPLFDNLQSKGASLYDLFNERLLLLVNSSGVAGPRRMLQVLSRAGHPVQPRLPTALQIAQQAWALFQASRQDTRHPDHFAWPHLHRVLTSSQMPGFPLLMRLYDDCDQLEYGRVPLWVYCARVCRSKGLPMVNYELWWHAKASPQAWKDYFDQADRDYPPASKRRQVVWRGTLTGHPDEIHHLPEPNITLTRWRLCRYVHDLPHADRALLDVGLVEVGNHFNETVGVHMHLVPPVVPRIPQDDFQHYVGVLDVDGNTWSARFSRLLCGNAVVLKIQPRYVDYLYASLQPWQHYIPIDADFANLLERVRWTLDDKNTPRIQQIVHNARLWCREHLIKPQLVRDTVDAWEWYVQQLDEGPQPHWSRLLQEQWLPAQQKQQWKDEWELLNESSPLLVQQ